MEYNVKNILTPELYGDILSITDSDTDFERFKNKTIIVTGAGQLTGFYIVCALLLSNDISGTNAKVVAVNADDSFFALYGKLTYRNDIEFTVSADYSYLGCDSADFIICTQSAAEIGSCEAVLNLLDFAKKTSARVVLKSSADVYGDVFNGKAEISEDDRGYINCADCPLAQEERMAESLAKKLAEENSADVSVARVNIVYGGMRFNSGFYQILDDVSFGKNPSVARRDCFPETLCYVSDAASAIMKVLLVGKSGEAYNISCGVSASECGFAQECAEVFPNIKPVYEGKERVLSPMSPTLRILSADKLRTLGFKPRVSLSDGIGRSVRIIKELRERGE